MTETRKRLHGTRPAELTAEESAEVRGGDTRPICYLKYKLEGALVEGSLTAVDAS